MFRGARRVVEVKEKRSPHGSEKTFATGSKSHNKEKYLQPMHLPTPTIFFFRSAHAFGRCTTLWRRKKNMFSSDDGTRSAKTTVFQKIVNLQIDFLCCLEKFEN